MNCPLCHSSNLSVLDNVKSNDIVAMYRSFCDLDLSYLFSTNIQYFCCFECRLKFFYPMVAGDEFFYKSLQDFDWYYLDDKNEYYFAREYVKENDLVIDVGCGRGAFASHVFAKNGKFLGLDFSAHAKALAVRDGIEIETQSIQDYAKENPESADLVTSFQVCEHVSDVGGFIEAKLQVLKPGGRMIIAVPSEDSFLSQVTNGILNMPPHHVTRWNDDVFTFVANKYSLELEKIYHEKLQDVHEKWYLSTLIQNSILKPKLIDLSLQRKLVSKFSSLVAGLLARGFNENMRPLGHTVTAVFRKI